MSSTLLMLGSTGPAVGELHQRLIEAGEQVDQDELRRAFFGESTKAAVIDFQTSHLDAHGKQLVADGVVGPITLAALANPRAPVEMFIMNGWRGEPTKAPNPEAMMAVSAAISEIGVKEEIGKPNRGQMVDIFNGPNYIGSPWCFIGETEILTESGWIAFKDLAEDTRVAQVDPVTHTLSLVRPLKRIIKQYEGTLVTIERRSVKLTMDPGHRLFGRWTRLERKAFAKTWPDFEFYPVSDLASYDATSVTIPPIKGTATKEAAQVSDRELKLLAAFFADGCIHRHKIDIQVSRDYKIEFLQSLEPDCVYTASRSYGPRSNEPLTTFTFSPPPVVDRAFDSYKVFSPSFLWSLTVEQARTLLGTITYLDGTIKGDCHIVTQASKERIDSLHVLSTIAGYPSQTRDHGERGEFGSHMFGITYETKGRPTRFTNEQVSTSFGKETLYCVSVPSELIVVRPPLGRAVIVGNCANFASWCWNKTPSGSPFGQKASALKIRDWGAQNNRILPVTEPVLPGDIGVIIRAGGRGHVEIVCGCEFDGKISLVGGNVGNAVRGTVRARDAFSHFVRPRG